VTARDRLRQTPLWETLRCPGGALCLDFCNSVQGLRNSESKEWLADFADLVDWLEASEAIDAKLAKQLRTEGDKAPKAAEEIWKRAIQLRDALDRVLLARAADRSPDGDDLVIIDAEYARTAAFAHLAATSRGFAWELKPDLQAALRPVVHSAIELMTSPRLERLRRCGGDTCYWLFIDETKNCSRRWCEMAICGNRHKVRRHRARQASGGAAAEADHPKVR
jgi:predicted RNA-binding Zn ribbon-like protein